MAIKEQFHKNMVEIEGVVTKVWNRKGDVFARIAIYDEHAEILEPAKNGGFPKRQAHYVTLQLIDGKTSDGGSVSLSAKDKVYASGFLRDSSFSESLQTFLRKAKKFDRIEDRDDDVYVGRVATYVVVESLIRYSN